MASAVAPPAAGAALSEHKIDFKTTPITDDYEILWHKKLGTGVNGDVVMCINRQTTQKYALKCLRDRPESRREIALQLACGNHPNVVAAIAAYDNTIRRGPNDFKPAQRTLLMVLELMEGGELFDRIMKKKSFTEAEASAVMREVASAIKHLHDKNIAHRDLKPENLLYTTAAEDSHLKLADFGFAKIDAGDLQTPVYTPYYVPTEILEAQRVQRAKRIGALPPTANFMYDKSCDMWSLGVILYILLCGYPPFQSEIPGSQLSEQMKESIRKGKYTFHEKYWGHISHDAKMVVSALLCTNPQERMTAAQLCETHWVRGVQVPMTPLMTPGALHGSAEEREAVMREMEETLTSMRARKPVQLKPLTTAKNKISQRRDQSAPMDTSADGATAAKPAPPPSLKSPAQLLSEYCLMPPPGHTLEQLRELTSRTLHALNAEAFGPVMEVLARFGWNGSQYGSEVNLEQLGRALSETIATS